MCVLKIKFLPSVVQKLSSEQTDRQTDRWTDRWTDRQTQLKLLPTTYADGKNITNSFTPRYVNVFKLNYMYELVHNAAEIH